MCIRDRVKELLKSDLCKVELIEGEENLQIWAVLEQAENQVQLQIDVYKRQSLFLFIQRGGNYNEPGI